jgi:hypothetical protein
MKNTSENKTKFFGTYLGSKVEITSENNVSREMELTPECLVRMNDGYYGDSIKLLLKNIKDISHDDSKECDKILGSSFDNIKGDFGFCVYRHAMPQTVYLLTYLKAHGYAVEFDIQMYVKYGWVKIIPGKDQ